MPSVRNRTVFSVCTKLFHNPQANDRRKSRRRSFLDAPKRAIPPAGAAAPPSRRSGVIMRTHSGHRGKRKQGEGDQGHGNFFERTAMPALRNSECRQETGSPRR
jgi:hypothetical protein